MILRNSYQKVKKKREIVIDFNDFIDCNTNIGISLFSWQDVMLVLASSHGRDPCSVLAEGCLWRPSLDTPVAACSSLTPGSSLLPTVLVLDRESK